MHNTYLVYLFENTEDWRDDSAVKDIRYSSTRPEFDFFFFLHLHQVVHSRLELYLQVIQPLWPALSSCRDMPIPTHRSIETLEK